MVLCDVQRGDKDVLMGILFVLSSRAAALFPSGCQGGAGRDRPTGTEGPGGPPGTCCRHCLPVIRHVVALYVCFCVCEHVC